MWSCTIAEADITVDGKPFRLDDLRGYLYIYRLTNSGYRAIVFNDERRTLSRLINQATESKAHIPKLARERMRILQQMPVTAIHGD